MSAILRWFASPNIGGRIDLIDCDFVGSLALGLLLFPSGIVWLLSYLGVPSVGSLGFMWEVFEGVV